jgi:hypothetical protein
MFIENVYDIFRSVDYHETIFFFFKSKNLAEKEILDLNER